MAILRTALKDAQRQIHLGYPEPYVVGPGESVIYRSDWEPTTTSVGRSVSPETAMTNVPFFAGVRLISQTVGRTPMLLYRRTADDDRERFTSALLFGIMRNEPNPEMSALVFKEALTGHLVTRGNCYAEKVRDDLGRVAQLWPLRPDRMQVLRDNESGRKFYRYRIEQLGDLVDLDAERVFHIPAFGFDGYVGYSIVTLFRQAIALGLSTEEFGARFFKSGAQPAAVVKHPADWDQKRIDNFAAKLRGNHSGLSNAQRIAILEDGISWEAVGMNLDDAQFLETRKFQRGETATMLGLPPHTIGDLERATFTNIEEQGLDLVTHGFGSWFDRWSEESNRQLARPAYGERAYYEFVVEKLLQGRALDQMKVFQMLWQIGGINAETIAKRLNLPAPEDGSGKAYYRPSNYKLALDPTSVTSASDDEARERRNGNGAGALPTDGQLERVG